MTTAEVLRMTRAGVHGWRWAACETGGRARELMGGNGNLLDHDVGRLVVDSEAIYSCEGTREMNTLIVGRSLTGMSAFV